MSNAEMPTWVLEKLPRPPPSDRHSPFPHNPRGDSGLEMDGGIDEALVTDNFGPHTKSHPRQSYPGRAAFTIAGS